MQRDAYSFVLATLLIFTLSACGGDRTDDAPSVPAGSVPPSNANLTNDGGVIGVDGVAVRALSDTLAQAIAVEIGPAPTPATPLPEDARVVGYYYEIRAHTDVPVEPASPFMLSFPVAAGVDTGQLALAVHTTLDSLHDATTPGTVWHLHEGRYDAASQALLVPVTFLAGAGQVYVLVTHPALSSPPTAPTAAPTYGAAHERRPNAAGGLNSDFHIACMDLQLLAQCTARFRQGAIDYLRHIHNELLSQGFREPRLEIQPDSYNPSTRKLVGQAYKVRIHHPSSFFCRSVAVGAYDPAFSQLMICAEADANGDFPVTVFPTLVHEFFHSVQHAYPETLKSALLLQAERWFMEGTATAAVQSYLDEAARGGVDRLMVRDQSLNLHPVDTGLRTQSNLFSRDDNSYRSQDFWVYIGRRLGMDLNYLIPILSAGPTIQHIDDYLTLALNPLGQSYWEWAKNQTFERVVETASAGDLIPICQLNLLAVDEIDPVVMANGHPWPWFPVLGNPQLRLTLPPLSSRLIRIDYVDGFPPRIRITHEVRQDPEIIYKVFSEFDAATPDACRTGTSDGARELDTAAWRFDVYGKPKFVYVLASNTHLSEAKELYLVGVPITP